jgi:hypothetical protein
LTAPAGLLAELAVPRLVGTPAHARVREILTRELERRGLVVMEHRFRAAPRFPLRGPAAVEGITLIGVRPRRRVRTWLAAHYDSKGQPLSMAGRLMWLGTAVAAIAGTLAAALLSGGLSLLWWLPAAALLAGWVALNTATDRTPGAVDNATGVLAVLAILDALPADADVGALLLDAEELGLVGARALARERANLLADTVVINFDGLDDRGVVWALMHKRGPVTQAVAGALGVAPRSRLPVLVDGIALAPPARECVTIMKGDWATMRVVHRPGDRADRLRLDGVGQVARALVAALAAQ